MSTVLTSLNPSQLFPKHFAYGSSMKQQGRFVRRLEVYCWVVQRRSQDQDGDLHDAALLLCGSTVSILLGTPGRIPLETHDKMAVLLHAGANHRGSHALLNILE